MQNFHIARIKSRTSALSARCDTFIEISNQRNGPLCARMSASFSLARAYIMYSIYQRGISPSALPFSAHQQHCLRAPLLPPFALSSGSEADRVTGVVGPRRFTEIMRTRERGQKTKKPHCTEDDTPFRMGGHPCIYLSRLRSPIYRRSDTDLSAIHHSYKHN